MGNCVIIMYMYVNTYSLFSVLQVIPVEMFSSESQFRSNIRFERIFKYGITDRLYICHRFSHYEV